MRLVKGNKIIDMSREELQAVARGYSEVVVDLGTGDGRFVYEKALKEPDKLFIGIDPSQKQLEIYSRKAVRRKLNNVLFVIGSLEIIPTELQGLGDKIYVILPWGSLLGRIVNPDPESVGNIKNLLKDAGGKLEIILGYALEAEPTQTERLNLSEINENMLKSTMVPKFEEGGFKFVNLQEIEKKDLSGFETSWSKKLTFGKDRPVFYIEMVLVS
jgi:16S rRNA (adenine(1408)-N(1))-methyltransferase